ncbi:MAG: pyroglutamyl-peptidase I [Inhella sp.]
MSKSPLVSLRSPPPEGAASGSGRPVAGILVTGFEPFGGDTANSSWAIAEALAGERIGDRLVHAACLPCRFDTSEAALREALRLHRPTLVLALGQAASRPVLSFERVAINWIDARIADNAGAQPTDLPVHARGPAAQFTNLPIKAMAAAAREAGAAAEISFSAGSFVCNQLFYALMRALQRRPGVRGGFLHVPALGGAMPLPLMLAGVRAALAAALQTQEDQHEAAGRLD